MSRATQRSTSSRPFSSRSRVQLHPKQGVAVFSTTTEILCGGAVGGRNLHLMRAAAISWCLLQLVALPPPRGLLARGAIHQHGRRAARHGLSWSGWRHLEGRLTPRFRTFQVCPKDLRAALRQGGDAGAMALGINRATSGSARLTELPTAGVCHGLRC
jgi:hypothetical protein